MVIASRILNVAKEKRGTYKTVKARFSGKCPCSVLRCFLFARQVIIASAQFTDTILNDVKAAKVLRSKVKGQGFRAPASEVKVEGPSKVEG